MDERSSRRNDKVKISELERIVKLDLQQKTKVKWIQDGDENFNYCHSMIKNKNKKNRIHGSTINGVWVSDLKEIKKRLKVFSLQKFMNFGLLGQGSLVPTSSDYFLIRVGYWSLLSALKISNKHFGVVRGTTHRVLMVLPSNSSNPYGILWMGI